MAENIETARTKQLQNLANQMPGANQQVARGLQEARTTQLQAQVQKMQPGATTGQVQQLGGQLAGQQAATGLQAAQQTQNQLQQVGQLGLQQQGRQERQTNANQQLTLSAKQRELGQKLSELGEGVKDKILDQNLQFKTDQAGRQLLNQRQLFDWAITNAKSQEEYNNYAQAAQQASERKIMMLNTAQAKIDQALKQGYISKNRPLDNELKKQLLEQRNALEKQIQNDKAKAANRAAMVQAGGAIVGAVVGGVLAGPGGASVGASVGGAAATTISGFLG